MTKGVFSAVIVAALLFGALRADAVDDLCSTGDPYSTGLVTSAFNFFKNPSTSFEGDAKQFVNIKPSLPELGDAVSVSILRVLRPSEIVQRPNAYAYLAVVSLAFSYPKRIAVEADRDPKVTLFLLEYLKEKEDGDAALEARISLITKCIQDFTCRAALAEAARSR